MSNSNDFAGPFAGARWVDIVPRRVACPDLPAEVLLHAGPPLHGPPPAPLMNAAIQALLFDERAANPTAARDLILRREVELRPAQDYAVVTPLAQVVSRSDRRPTSATHRWSKGRHPPCASAVRHPSVCGACATSAHGSSAAWRRTCDANLLRSTR
jgi:hypothetical protein